MTRFFDPPHALKVSGPNDGGPVHRRARGGTSGRTSTEVIWPFRAERPQQVLESCEHVCGVVLLVFCEHQKVFCGSTIQRTCSWGHRSSNVLGKVEGNSDG